jgi:diguanylate cyclase (GGDEF)-like protein
MMPILCLFSQRQRRAIWELHDSVPRKQTGSTPAMQDKHRLLTNLGLLSVLAVMFILVYASLPQTQSASVSMALRTGTTDHIATAYNGGHAAMLPHNAGPETPHTWHEVSIRDNTQQALNPSRNDNQTTRLLITLTCIVILFGLLLARTVIQHVSAINRQSIYRSSHDKLTGLINRCEFQTRVERAIRHAQTQSVTHALLHIDIDRFKSVNDTCGHSAGNELLQELAQLLLSSVRKRDTLSRLGGDEFGMLLENCPLDKAVQIAGNLIESVGSFHFTRSDNTFKQGISIGVVPIDRDSTDSAAAMNAADSACYLAKESGRNKVQIAHLGNHRLQVRHGQMQWLSRLNNAFTDNRFTLYFQPIVPCASTARHDKYVEILLRMIDDDGSIIAPGVFLPTAEKYNLAQNLDRWVIEHAMSWLARESACSHWPIRIAINLSAQSVGNQAMVNYIIEQAELKGINPGQVCFEITETAVTANLTAATGFMLTLRACGFRFSLDDFGNGLSSFAYLKMMPVDYLKIDGAFVRDFMFDPVDRTMVRAINELGHLLGKQTIAKYVESLEVVDELKKMGIDHIQGYVYSQPQSLDDFAQVLGPRMFVVSSGTGRQGIV